MDIRPWLPLALALTLTAPPAQAAARQPDTCGGSALRDHPPAVNFRVDNDLFGSHHQDQGYTNGAMLTFVSPNLVDYTDDPCLPAPARWINRHLERLQSGGFDQQNMIFSVGQGLFTPTDSTRADLIEDDLPYAGVLLANFGYNARIGDRLRTTQLAVGMVGPSAQGKQVQDAVHSVLHDEKFRGWKNQLHDEPVFRLLQERMRRWPANNAAGWGWDAISHWGGAVGNLATYANGGGEVRFGWQLPDDFGSSPMRPAGENTAPTRGARLPGWSGHLFATTDARWVLRDITLDGNTFRRGHSVDKRALVGDIGYGVALMRGKWKFALARYPRSREFEGQKERPVFGSFTISRTL
ncbi:MAG: lipid A deacylase LpxR family protein [Stenotrophomonas nitritireducens]|uniref:Lipid A deacylase LpxR family protein n=1 Tax=Stenotrophomonas nitritireducens TaxID=83617 RepID=A0A9D8KX79_9GAMM|nr:lipid A deacylase LpxR family protein [Stenotrophomonas nitritireducens]